jgi:hypothetical protein
MLEENHEASYVVFIDLLDDFRGSYFGMSGLPAENRWAGPDREFVTSARDQSRAIQRNA